MQRTFPFLHADDIDLILEVCGRNNGLSWFPKDNPTGLFAYYRFYPQMIHVVECQDFDVLLRSNLTRGPFVYIAAYITPGEVNNYRVMWRLIQSLDGVYGFAFHRRKKDRWRFQLIKNSRLIPQRSPIQ